MPDDMDTYFKLDASFLSRAVVDSKRPDVPTLAVISCMIRAMSARETSQARATARKMSSVASQEIECTSIGYCDSSQSSFKID